MKTQTKSHPGFGYLTMAICLVAFTVFQSCNKQKSKGWLTVSEESITLPTYLVDPPNPMPRFYEGRVHQGVQRRMYPYPMNDQMTGVKEDRDYQIIYLENAYIKVGIMPGMGGRIYSAVDKTNGYDFFYRNEVIKPSLIGMIGYWISGGNAWGYPHHHGPNTVEPMDYTIEEHPDGRVTVWLSYTEHFHRLRILCGFTMHPNSSVIDMTIRPFNPTPYVHSFLFWANPSVHANEDYQVIFPPSVEYITQHHKNEMTTWPVADRYYNRFDYTGLDVSMWKNTGVPSSFFSWDPREDFFGGYDHGREAGTAWIGNHHTMPGMKYWADGNNPAGVRINNGLTDDSGQYIELMAGAFADNQPDYSWLQPYESKNVSMSWYPIRLLGGLIEANRDAALNLEFEEPGKIFIALNTTRSFRNARIELQLQGESIFTEKINISPSEPYVYELHTDGPVDKEDLVFSMHDASGELVLNHQSRPAPGKPMPEPLQSPPAPQNVASVEELYLHGLRLDQFHNASISSYDYYAEALRRDPGDYRVNTQLGILYAKRKMFEEAEKYLQTAVDRITMRYTRPKDSDALYYLGVVQRRLHKPDAAYDHFYRASWNAGWHSAAFHQLAEMDCLRGDYAKALEHINRAISTNNEDVKAVGLKLAILRKLGRLEEALELANQLISNDLLSYHARNELYLISMEQGRKRPAATALKALSHIMSDRVQSYIEFATDYANCGMYEEAIEILSRAENNGESFPILYYHLGYYWSQLGDAEKASQYFAMASQKPHDYCFPFRDESLEAFQEALVYHPDDAMANYYLGNMLYELQPEKAIAFWEASRSLDPDFYITRRNLAWAAQQQNKHLEAAVLYGDAFERNREDTRLMFECDQAFERAAYSPQIRYERIYEGNRHISKKQSATYLRELELLNFMRRYDEVIEILGSEDFIESEGSQVLRDIFHNAHIYRSLQMAGGEQYEAAISDMQAALDFPIGRWGSERRAQMHYLMGTYLERSGQPEKAKESYSRAVEELAEGSEFLYDKGMAYLKLGQLTESRRQFSDLLDLATRRSDRDVFRSFEAGSAGAAREARNTYIRGLAYKGLGRTVEADQQFNRALELDPAFIQARVMLDTGY